MAVGNDTSNGTTTRKDTRMAPVHLFSHGSTMMLGEDSASARYWKKCGDEALANGVEHIIMMGAHWTCSSKTTVLLSANPSPKKHPVVFVDPAKYKTYPLNPDLAFLPTIASHLTSAGIACRQDPRFDWIHDSYTVLINMFPDPSSCPPVTIVSTNHMYDPHFHVSVGAALRPLREDFDRYKTLFVGSGGAVHNLYRNVWGPMLRHRDNFAQPTPPEAWALDFRQEVIDALCYGHQERNREQKQEEAGLLAGGGEGGGPPGGGVAAPPYGAGAIRSAGGVGGPMLCRRATSLMKHPKFRDAHATDDHFIPVLFIAGLCGGARDVEQTGGIMGAEDWELTNMCNSQFTLGGWDQSS